MFWKYKTEGDNQVLLSKESGFKGIVTQNIFSLKSGPKLVKISEITMIYENN